MRADNVLIKVLQTDIDNSWVNWLMFHYGLDCEETMDRWCNCIDPGDKNKEMISPWGEDGEYVEVFPDIADRIKLLSGPHYHMFIKAYYAVNPWNKT